MGTTHCRDANVIDCRRYDPVSRVGIPRDNPHHRSRVTNARDRTARLTATGAITIRAAMPSYDCPAYTGEILGRQKLSAAAAPLEPVVADGTLLLITDDARLLALR